MANKEVMKGAVTLAGKNMDYNNIAAYICGTDFFSGENSGKVLDLRLQ